MYNIFKVLVLATLIGLTIFPSWVLASETCALSECQNVDKLKICAGCRMVRYCSVDHQKADWPGHRDTCQARKSDRARKDRAFQAMKRSWMEEQASKKSRLERLAAAAKSDDDNIRKINPHFNESQGYSHNSSFCANLFAYFLRFGHLGVYNDGAIPFDPKKDQLYLKKNVNLYEEIGGGSREGNYPIIKDIEGALREADEATFFIVIGYRPFKAGAVQSHSWIAFRVDENIYHKCPQSGRNLPFPFKEFSQFFYYPVE